MEPEEIRVLVQEMERRSSPAVELLPGTLESVFNNQGTVVLDGTSSAVTVDVIAECSAQDRVMVLFVPPRGAFVVGRYGSPPPGPGWNLLDSVVGPTGVAVLNVPEFASDWTRFRVDATGRNPSGAALVGAGFNLGTTTLAGNTTYYVNGNATNATFQTTPTSGIFVMAEWGTAVENTAYIDLIRNGDQLSMTGGGARYSNTLSNNRRFFAQARGTMSNPNLQVVSITDSLGFSLQTPNVEISSATLYGLNPG